MTMLAMIARLPNTCARWTMAHCQQTIRAARLQAEAHALAELCRCLESYDEGHIFQPPFLVIKGRVRGRSRLLAARLTPTEVERCRKGMPLPMEAADFVLSTRPLWRRIFSKPVMTLRELPGSAVPQTL